MATDLLEMMLATSHVDLQLLDQSVADGDVGEAVHRLHRMLGALQLFTDAPALTEGRHWLEDLQKNNDAATLQELPPYIDSLRRLLGELGAPDKNPAAD
jgi:HPt (histidine-containing phosphotransfer) domain-containing protein